MPRKDHRALQAIERRNVLLQVLSTGNMWMTVRYLRHFVNAKRPVVEQDLRKLAELGFIETASVKDFNPELDRGQIVMMARTKKE